MINVLILGASGFVGSYIYNYFYKSNSYKILGTYFKTEANNLIYLDKLDKGNLHKILYEFNPDIVIDSSYEANVDKCEIDANSSDLNVQGTENIVEICKKTDSLLIFVSTDYVFDGENGPYTESDEPNPINVYGRQKLKSEKIIQNELDRFLIVRVVSVYGCKVGSKNTLQKLKDAEKNNIDIVKYVNDQWTTPTYVEDIPKGIETLLRNDCNGVWHISSGQFLNRFDFASKLINKYNINVKVEPTRTNQVKDVAPRPKKGGLKIDRIKRLGFIPQTL